MSMGLVCALEGQEVPLTLYSSSHLDRAEAQGSRGHYPLYIRTLAHARKG